MYPSNLYRKVKQRKKRKEKPHFLVFQENNLEARNNDFCNEKMNFNSKL